MALALNYFHLSGFQSSLLIIFFRDAQAGKPVESRRAWKGVEPAPDPPFSFLFFKLRPHRLAEDKSDS